MNDQLLTNVNISQLRDAFKDSEQISVGDDFCIVDMKFRPEKRSLNFPFRFDGLLFVWCIKGSLNISINLNEYQVNESTLFLCLPGNILKLNEIVGDHEELHYVCVAMTKEFASNQKIDLNNTYSNVLSLLDDPRVTIGSEEGAIMARQLDLIARVASSDLKHRKECVLSLWSSMLCVFACVLDKVQDTEEPKQVGSRSRLLSDQFLRLVGQYHTKYRNVGFYADKLCLTPKYLSKLIKTATGRSAPEWIDSYVILEAKNLLKYSNCTIKEIVYKLNFPNQSVFYKFFKARTGMTPSEYRNS